MTERITRCKECGQYLSVKYDTDELIYEWKLPAWEPMPNAKVTDLAIPDYQTNYTCFSCEREHNEYPSN